ncbi:MAG TPA: bifunctional (p)ppGpp synthetase/guanosine-3',5'-bis(diphosphate) 3'-pyrophosphohydrolase [Nitrospiria bacterium]|nr:bifunctional (p)ppGpp synthetase/guanosine-3',5'-bis(diphosphate) 3'-pyrophosphohydrolase [Nitrospiria bacterium]
MSPLVAFEDILHRVTAYNPGADIQLLRKAYDVSFEAHAGQVRESGEPYVKHPLEVAQILTKLKLDVPSIAAGLLHDTVEDTDYTPAQIKEHFTDEIAKLVDGVTKISKIPFRSQEEKQAENFRKMILFMADDIRVVLIKLADRLHNMRTLEHLPEARRLRVAQETQDIYAPLANRLGIGWMKAELEDLCLRYLHPDEYASLSKKIAQKKDERDRMISEQIQVVKRNLVLYGFPGEVTGRSKHLYSIYQKMKRQGITFEEIYDLAAIRIITDTKMNCYGILGMIHSLWRPVPGRFKDYIGVPKSNLYQSLHTTVVGPKGQHVEFQIRTEEMHRVAEEGIAAHWKYKEQGRIDDRDDRLFAWLRQLVEWQQELSDSRQFLDSVKMDLFGDVIYVFTPKGDIRELPSNSSPIDFAYAIHTEIGHHCSGAKVNGKLVPLRHQLKSGDTVEILTTATQTPTKDWLKYVRTPRAKTRIKHWIKVEEQRRSLELGRQLLERELRRVHLSPGEVFKSGKLEVKAKEAGLASTDDLLIAIGYGKLSAQQVANWLLPEPRLKEGLKEKIIGKIGLGGKGVSVRGVGDVLVHFSKCCNPLPGDPIIGFVTRGRGLSIHAVHCPNIDQLDYDKDRLVEVRWETEQPQQYPVQVSVLAVDRPGMLAAVSAAISAAQTNIRHADISTSEAQKAELNFVIDVKNTAHLDRVLKNIQKVDGVVHARRVIRKS